MAIRNILKSTAQGILGKNLRKVAGNIGSLIGGVNKTNSSDFEGINRSKQATNMLSFPIDVGNEDPATGGNHGHYIMFFVNEQNHARLKFDNIDDTEKLLGIDNLLKESKKRGLGILTRLFDTKDKKIKVKDDDPLRYIFVNGSQGGPNTEAAQRIIMGSLATGSINNRKVTTRKNFQQTISVDRAPVKRLDSVITMFMPADVKVNYKSNYTDTSIGVGAQSASQVIGEYNRTGDLGGAVDTLFKNSGDLAAAASRNALIAALSTVPLFEGSKEALEIGLGQALTDRMEMAFKGIDKRKFSYTFKMMPRSQDEADEVKRIIDMFKFHMLPEMSESSSRGRLMNYPSTFDIKYMYRNSENTYLNKVSECYLESMNVDYSGDRYRTHEGNDAGAPPIETTITLEFGEIELITREKALEGF